MKTRNATATANADADAGQAQWAAAELTRLIQRVGRTTVAGLILTQAQCELESLTRCEADDGPIRAFGPVRVPAAA